MTAPLDHDAIDALFEAENAARSTAPLVDRARHDARRLRAAARQPGWFGKRAAEIGRKLAWERRHAEPVVINGPYAHLSGLHCFLRDWRHAIDAACRVRSMRNDELLAHSKDQRLFVRTGRV